MTSTAKTTKTMRSRRNLLGESVITLSWGVMVKRNCWEYKRCGKEPGGVNVQELGPCPATTEGRLDGVHGGKNGGRACWVVDSTLCNNKVQGTFGKKFSICLDCDFYQLVKQEENTKFFLAAILLDRLQ